MITLPYFLLSKEKKTAELKKAGNFLFELCNFKINSEPKLKIESIPVMMIGGALAYLETGGNPRSIINKITDYYKVLEYIEKHQKKMKIEYPFLRRGEKYRNENPFEQRTYGDRIALIGSQ
jgi:hypothetical protein